MSEVFSFSSMVLTLFLAVAIFPVLRIILYNKESCSINKESCSGNKEFYSINVIHIM